jgi:hypothetical protein
MIKTALHLAAYRWAVERWQEYTRISIAKDDRKRRVKHESLQAFHHAALLLKKGKQRCEIMCQWVFLV